ncbi:hypothetical protein Tco_0249437 [Tanacetum coccineum]
MHSSCTHQFRTRAYHDDPWTTQFRARPIAYAPSTSYSLSSSQVHPPVFPQGVAAGPTIKDTSITQADLYPSVNPVAGEPGSAQSTSEDVSLAEPNQVNQPPYCHHELSCPGVIMIRR